MANNYSDLLKTKSTGLYIGWAIFIALLTLLPGNAFPHWTWTFASLDKWVHFIVFLVLSATGMMAFTFGSLKRWGRHPILLSLLIAILYGASLEYTQALIPDRTFDYADMLANTGGSLGGYLAFKLILLLD